MERGLSELVLMQIYELVSWKFDIACLKGL